MIASPNLFARATDASILTTTNTTRQRASKASSGSTNADLSCSPFALLSTRRKQPIYHLAMMNDSARVRLTDQHSSRQKKRRRSDADADASDAGGQRTSTGCATTSSSHRLSRHTCTAAHALVLLLSANFMFCTDAFSNENILSRNNFGRTTPDVPSFYHHGPATGAFSSNTKRYSRSRAMVILSASRERTDTTSSSGSGSSSSSSSSRFGVRKRVKSVIQKAKSRKIAKAARAEAAEAEAEIQHIIEEDDKIFEEEKNKESEVTIEVVSDTESSSGPQTVDSDVEEVEEVNGAVFTQAAKETDAGDDIQTVSLSEKSFTQASEQATDSEPKSTTTSKEEVASESMPPKNEDEDGGDDDAAEDVIVADAEPLPFELPELTDEQQRQLDIGERVQFQNDMGREGSGFVVLDVKAPPDVVWECLLDFQSYPETIPTVREVTMYTNTHLSGDYRSEKPVAFEDGTMATLAHGVPSVTRAAFTLSKFRLKIAAIHRYTPHPVGDYMVFTLDPACTNLVLKDAKGIWHTQSNPDNKGEDYTRVWLLCEVKVSKLLPQWITDYAARRAMPRATTWLRPQVEAANALWLSKKRRRRRN